MNDRRSFLKTACLAAIATPFISVLGNEDVFKKEPAESIYEQNDEKRIKNIVNYMDDKTLFYYVLPKEDKYNVLSEYINNKIDFIRFKKETLCILINGRNLNKIKHILSDRAYLFAKKEKYNYLISKLNNNKTIILKLSDLVPEDRFYCFPYSFISSEENKSLSGFEKDCFVGILSNEDKIIKKSTMLPVSHSVSLFFKGQGQFENFERMKTNAS